MVKRECFPGSFSEMDPHSISSILDCLFEDRLNSSSWSRNVLIKLGDPLMGKLFGGSKSFPSIKDPAQLSPANNSNQALHANPASRADTQIQLEALNERWQMFLIALYSMTAITSFVLNVITIIVLWHYRGTELRKYLINLSLSDLLMSCFSIRK